MFAGLTQRLPIFSYLREVRDELQKVTWPTREQTIQKTSLVIGVSIAVGLYIGLLDYLFTQLMGFLLK
jgi:preprotein translocase subunit SecE